jgi:type I restriction enzyme S subunit
MRDWSAGILSDAIESLDAGVSVNAEDRPHGAGEIGVLKTSAASGGKFIPEQNKTILPHERRLVSEPVQGDSIIVSRMNTPALVGESCYVKEPHPSLFLPDRLWQLKPKDRTKLSMRWLSFILQSRDYRRYIEVHATGTSGSMKNLPKSKLMALPVHFPEYPEQALIAQILDTLDTAIQETEALIAKLKAVKQGLLHDLLTRGIDANGELRPPQAEAPQLYKESALGWIPKEWTPVQIGKLATLQRGHDIVEACFVYGTYPVISSSGVIGYHNVATSRGPNVVVGRKGSIGTVHYVEGDFWAHDTSLFVTNFFGNDVRFVFHLFDYMDLGRFGTKSGSPSLNRNDVHPLIVGRPSHAEQERIVLAIASHESTSQKTILELAKLRILKSGLMDDLLTGRVRVTPLLEGHAT